MDNILFSITGNLFFICILIYSSVIDIKTRRVQNCTYVSLFFISFIPKNIDISASLIGAAVVFLPLLTASLLCKKGTEESFGGGDVKFASMCGFFIGNWQSGLLAMLIACTLYLIIIPVMKKFKMIKDKKIPFIPFISVGFLTVLILKLLF